MNLLSRVMDLFAPRGREHRKERKRAARMRARELKFYSASWQRDAGVARRDYASYDEYVAQQVSKLSRIDDRLRSQQDDDRRGFARRFAACPAFVNSRVVICLGSRLGAEVAALHQLGHFAVGIDLNPGEKNELVLHGDFHKTVFPDNSVDVVFTNALDHAFDLESVLSEVRRLLRPDGVFLAELVAGHEEGFFPGDYEAMHWRSVSEFAGKIAEIGGFSIEESRELGKLGRDAWTQVMFRKLREPQRTARESAVPELPAT